MSSVFVFFLIIDFCNSKYIIHSGDFNQHRISRLVWRIVNTMSINFSSFSENIIQTLIKSLIRHPIKFCFRNVKDLAKILCQINASLYIDFHGIWASHKGAD